MTPEALTVVSFEFEDIPPSLLGGGATSFENVCLSCPTCNRYNKAKSKGDHFRINGLP